MSAGPPTLAADLLLIMLDDSSGKLRVHPRVAGYALAGALLVELWATRRITMDNLQISIALDQRLPADDLLRTTLGWLLTEPEEVGVTSWVEALAATALDRVAHQLVRSGWIRRVGRRRLTGSGAVYEPVDQNRMFWRAGRLVTVLASEPQWSDALLFALIDAAGFTPGLLLNVASPPSRTHLGSVVDKVRRTYPAVADVVGVVQNRVDRVAVAPRR